MQEMPKELTEYDYEAMERRKTIKGMKELNRRCHCGKMKVNHTVMDANTCKKTAQTQTVGKIMSPQEIEDSRLMKI